MTKRDRLSVTAIFFLGLIIGLLMNPGAAQIIGTALAGIMLAGTALFILGILGAASHTMKQEE